MKEMKPFFEANDLLVAKVEAKTKAMQYGILAYMVFQWSALARLTWWEYSWDIMEPVTYFITYGYIFSDSRKSTFILAHRWLYTVFTYYPKLHQTTIHTSNALNFFILTKLRLL